MTVVTSKRTKRARGIRDFSRGLSATVSVKKKNTAILVAVFDNSYIAYTCLVGNSLVAIWSTSTSTQLRNKESC